MRSLPRSRPRRTKAAIPGVSEQLAADIATLDSLDAEIEAFCASAQNGFFTEADQNPLQEMIDTREAIEIKYRLSPADADGFDTIGRSWKQKWREHRRAANRTRT